MGNLTRDPELKYTPAGMAICEISVAVNEVTGSGHNRKEHVSFFDVTFFKDRAETVAKYFSKGKPIFVEGRLRQERWEAQDGSKKSRVGIVGDAFTFISAPTDDGQQAEPSNFAPQEKREQRAPQNQQGTMTQLKTDGTTEKVSGVPEDEEDIPF